MPRGASTEELRAFWAAKHRWRSQHQPRPALSGPVAESCAPPCPGCLQVNDACVALLLTVSPVRTTQYLQPKTQGMQSVDKRLRYYRRSLAQWNADDATVHAVVVVSSGRDTVGGPCGPELGQLSRLELVTFEHSRQLEQRYCGNVTEFMGEHELVAIAVAMRHSKRINARRTTHVLKLTGRYYVPRLPAHLRLLHRGTDVIRQGGRIGQCMVMGCKRGSVCRQLWECPYEFFGHCEATQARRMNESRFDQTSLLLPWMPVLYTATGSGNEAVAEIEGGGASGNQLSRQLLGKAMNASVDFLEDLRRVRRVSRAQYRRRAHG